MSTSYNSEQKELDRLKTLFSEKAPTLVKELERLSKVDDEIGILVSSRRSLEVIISEVCEKELERPRGSEPLKGIIEKLNKEKKIPSFIFTSMINLNSLSTYGAHPKTFSPRQVKTVLNELLTIVEWYAKWHGIEPGKAKDVPGDQGHGKETEPDDDEYIGKSIGNYKLLESIGEGGMGQVYMAQQSEPVKRRVALKIIKLGMDTREVVARFRAEQQALAVMDHPNIAKVYDAGATDTGRPYFVMELIRGIPVTTYCDNHKLSTRERLELFLPICHAIQHAHQKGIIHRDLKPSNILVAEDNDKPVIKIIDFGIAKAIDHRLTSQTLHTRQDQLIGTPEYMSPEQALRSGMDIDTRADIFSLGVILYELLAGVLPFDPKAFQDTGIDEIQQILTEIEPPKVSTRISKLGDTQTTIAERRKTDPAGLQSQIKGDLDWITMKAMSKDRVQRYQSASEFAADVERHLNNEPILASPPSAVYRFKKYVKRHKIEVVAAAIVLLALIGGFTATSISMVKAKKAEAMAIEEARTAEETSRFLTELFEVSDPNEAKGDTITAREILDKGAVRIENELSGEPEIKARMMTIMGNVYFNMGLYTNAEELYNKALSVVRNEFGRGHVFEGYALLNTAKVSLHNGEFDDAIKLCRQADSILADNDETDPLEYSRCFLMQGMALSSMLEYDTAKVFFERTIKIIEDAEGPDHISIAEPYYHLGWIYHTLEEEEEALKYYTKSLEIREKELGEESIEVALCLDDLGNVSMGMNNYDEASSYFNRSLAIFEKLLGPNHKFVADVVNNIGVLAWYQQDWETVRQSWERTLELREEIYGQNHPLVASINYNLGLLEMNFHNYDEAKKYYLKALAINEEVLGPDNSNSEAPLHSLAYIYMRTGDYNKAKETYKRILDIRTKVFGEEHQQVVRTKDALARTLRNAGEYPESLSLYEEVQKLNEKHFGKESSENAISLMEIAIVRVYMKDYATADSIYNESISLFEKTGEDRPEELMLYYQVGYFAATGERDKAIDYLRKMIAAGYTNTFFYDKLMEPLADDPEYKSIVAEFKEMIAME